MKNKDEILKYLSGLMSDSEQINFEKKIKQSDELMEELKLSQAGLERIDELKNIELDMRYFGSILPRVREKLDSKKREPFPKIAYSLSFVVTVLLVIMINSRQSTLPDSDNYLVPESVITESAGDEIFLRLDSDILYNPDYVSTASLDTNWDPDFLNGLQISASDVASREIPVLDDFYLQQIGESEAPQIYAALINKKF